MLSFILSRTTLTSFLFFFFFNDTATTEIYTLSLHDALPISTLRKRREVSGQKTSKPLFPFSCNGRNVASATLSTLDRKSTRLNSSHGYISYAVFCLKKKKEQKPHGMYHLRGHFALCVHATSV